jgi:hypothetical protein
LQVYCSLHHDNRPQISDVALQNVMLALLGFGLALVTSFLAMPPFLPFGMGMLTLCYWILKVYDVPFDFTGLIAKSLPWVSEKTGNSGFWTRSELLRLSGLLEVDMSLSGGLGWNV